MPLFEIATAAQLAGSVVLALFFVLLERHDPRPYLADWMAAWIAQAVALAVFLASLRWGWSNGEPSAGAAGCSEPSFATDAPWSDGSTPAPRGKAWSLRRWRCCRRS